MKRLTYLCGAVIALALMSGCQQQPYDSVTGEKVGGTLSATDPHPTTSPAGNHIVEKTTSTIDTDKVVDTVNGTVQTTAPAFGPWGMIIAAAAAVAVDQYHRRKKTPPKP